MQSSGRGCHAPRSPPTPSASSSMRWPTTPATSCGRWPKAAEPWSLTSLREKVTKIGAKVVSHDRYVTFQVAEVAVPRQMFQEILSLIARLRAPPARASGARGIDATNYDSKGAPRCRQSCAFQRLGAVN